jgi:hypothetical protein
MRYFIFFYILIFSSFSIADELNICSSKFSTKFKVSADLEFCTSEQGISINYFNKSYFYEFINHLETQFYIIKSLPSGFLCRDGIFTGRKLPPPKYQPNNGKYLYKLDNKFTPVLPTKSVKFKIREYLMNYSSLERRKLQALALVIYNGNKNISSGNVILFPKDKENIMNFKISKCRLEMTQEAKIINKYTMKRR